jgi:hypothetical protein
MSYTVTLSDSSFNDVPDTSIQLEAVTPGGTVLDSQGNGVVSTGNGATLSFTPARQRFSLEIDTAGTRYAPLVLKNLNGDRHPQTIDVILLAMPTSSSGPNPTTTAAVRPFIQRQSWVPEQRAAVYTTIDTLCILKGVPGSASRHIRRATEDTLSVLGINPDLIV